MYIDLNVDIYIAVCMYTYYNSITSVHVLIDVQYAQITLYVLFISS